MTTKHVTDILKSLDKKRSSPADLKIQQELISSQELHNALLNGNSRYYDNPEKPLGTRYFVENGKKTNQDGEEVDTYYVIDNMKYGKNEEGKIDLNNYGLLPSALENVKEVNTVEGFVELMGTAKSNDITTIVEVDVEVDPSGNMETKNISMKDYKHLDCTAFKDNCKKYKGMLHCDTCDTIQVNENPAIGPLSDEEMNAMIKAKVDSDPEVQAAKKQMEQAAGAVKSMSSALDEAFTDKPANIESFYGRYQQPLNNYRINDDGFLYQIENISESRRLEIKKDVTSTLWIGGITIIGLFILAKYM